MSRRTFVSDEPTPTTQQVMDAYVGSPYWTRKQGLRAAFFRWLQQVETDAVNRALAKSNGDETE